MKITKKWVGKDTIVKLCYYGVDFIGVFTRLNNTIEGHPKYKVVVIRGDWLNNNYETWGRSYNVVQVYESLKECLINLIEREGLR